MALKGLNAAVKITGTPTSMTAEATTASGNITYQITNAAKRILSPTAAITVKDGGVTTVEAYTVNRLTGTVTFGTTASRTITIDGTYLPVATLGESKMLSYKIGGNNIDVSRFGDTYKRRRQGTKDFTASVGGFLVDETYTALLEAGNPIVLQFYHTSSGSVDLRAWVIPSADSIQSMVEGVVEDALEFVSTIDADGNTVAVTGF